MKKQLKIGLAQTRQVDDIDANARTILDFIEQAGKAGVQILCFPETQTVGYRVDIARPDTPVPVKKLREVHDSVAHRCGELNLACILGTETPLESDPHAGKPHNSALVISERGKILGVHHKTKLTPLDAIAYTPGSGFQVFKLHGVTVGVVICFEGFRFPESTRECVRQGAQIVFHPQSNTTRPNEWKIPIHQAMITTRAAENTIWFASCNACLEPHQNCRSMIISPDGRVHAHSELRREELVVADIDVSQATRAMFLCDLEGCAPLLFGSTVKREEYESALKKR
ncbi:MAG: carbon-nitrogen hydrolase family protein [Armatimonadetes bacterium]|nr:carbon-nitrogen hydrolase family protein [Planctomycetota bacterium]MBI2201221.1 carbon-nitrogen hydrolase family protein [Armatimonadota bacterium]